MPRSRFSTLSLLVAATFCLAAAGEVSARPVTVVTGSDAASHSDVKIAIAGKTLKLQRVRRLNIDFPEGMMMNARPFAASCTFRAFERGQCKVKQQVGQVALAVAFGGRSYKTNGKIYVLKTGKKMVATLGVKLKLPKALKMPDRNLVLVDNVRLRPSDNGLVHSFGELPRALSGTGRTIGDMSVSFRAQPGGKRSGAYFLTNPTRCTPSAFRVSAVTWAGFFTPVTGVKTYAQCDRVPFEPTFSFSSASTVRKALTGFSLSVAIPTGDAAVQSGHVRKLDLLLPTGSSWDTPSFAVIGTCSSTQLAAASCPQASAFGKVELSLPSESRPLTGAMYLTDRSDERATFAITARSKSGAQIVLHGSLAVSGAATGERPELTLDDTAQLPYSISLTITAALLKNAKTCEARSADASFLAYSGATAARSVAYRATTCPGPPQAPRITSGVPNAGFTNVSSQPFGFDAPGSEANYFECQSDAGDVTECGSPNTAAYTGEGQHTFSVRAVNDDGVGATSTRSFTLDQTNPAVTIIQPNVSGTQAFGAVAPAVTFGATDSSPVSLTECRLRGEEPDVTTSYLPCSAGYELPIDDENAWAVDVRATDAAGNQAVASRTFVVDQTAPTVGAVSLYKSDESTSTTITNDDTPLVTFSATDPDVNNPKPTPSTECEIDPVSPAGAATTVPCASGSFRPALADGSYTLSVVATDAAGNVGTTAPVAFVVDTTAPTAAISAPASGAFTNDSTPNASFTTTDATATSATCAFDAASFTTCSTGVAPDAALADGSHTVRVRVTDAAGNTATTPARSFTVDTTDPAVSISAPQASDFTSDTTPSITFSATDANLDTRECAVDAGAPVLCTSSFTPATLGQGIHSVAVFATDKAGNTKLASVSFTVDSVNPAVNISSPTNNTVTADDTPSVTFAVTDATATTTQCRVVGVTSLASCTSPYTPTALPDGTYTLEVKATDAATNTGIATVSLRIDTTDPAVSISAPANNSITSNATPSVNFTTTDASTVTTECTVDLLTPVSCATGFQPSALIDGEHTITVTATDEVGNVGSSSTTFRVDTNDPAVNISSPANNAVTADDTPNVTFAVTDATATTTQCRVVGVTSLASCTSPYTPASLPDGTYTIEVKATDAASNTGTTTVDLRIDTTDPAVAISTPAHNSITSNTTPNVNFTATDASAVTTECTVDSEEPVSCSTGFIPSALLDGEHTITVTATDQVGNVGAASTAFRVDTTDPVVAISSPTNNTVTPDDTPSITFGVTDATAITTQCRVVGVTSLASCTSPYTPASLPDGTYTIEVKATDAASNTGTTTVDLRIDTADPAVAISAPANNSITANTTPSVNFTATDASTVTAECTVDSEAPVSCSTGFMPSALLDGEHTITVTATDQVGNVGAASTTFRVDVTDPLVTITAPGAAAFVTDPTPDVDFAIADDTSTTAECKIDGGAFDVCTTPYAPVSLLDGEHTVTVRATDEAGNDGDASVTFTLDTEAPDVSISVPLDGSVGSDTTPIVSFSATDTNLDTVECGVDAGTAVPCESGDELAALDDGSHTVSVTATDLAGHSTTESVTITVDTTAPQLTLDSPIEGGLYSLASGDVTLAFSILDTTATTAACVVDLAPSYTCNSGETLAGLSVGPHTLELTITDEAGWETTQSVAFDVEP